MTERPARLKLYEVSAQVLTLTFVTGMSWEVKDGIPRDAKLHEVGYNRARGLFEFVLEHPDFDMVHEGEEMPRGDIEMSEGDD